MRDIVLADCLKVLQSSLYFYIWHALDENPDIEELGLPLLLLHVLERIVPTIELFAWLILPHSFLEWIPAIENVSTVGHGGDASFGIANGVLRSAQQITFARPLHDVLIFCEVGLTSELLLKPEHIQILRPFFSIADDML